MPVLFLGHGSPMNVITDNPFRTALRALGEQWRLSLPRPQLILCVSAHWLTRGWWMTGQAQPPTIHDFGGFPDELFAQHYRAPGAPEAVAQLCAEWADAGVGIDTHQWGYDHGTWGVLQPLFPHADIPVVQLSLNWDLPPAQHLAMGRRLRALRERGVLVVGSGNIVHNLRVMRRDAPVGAAYDWAIAFDRQVTQWIEQGDTQALADFQSLGDTATLAHPSHEHYLPLLHTAGATHEGEPVRFFNDRFQHASVSMRSVVWG
jgi:4,5-DOPA dioxygenase extradiol